MGLVARELERHGVATVSLVLLHAALRDEPPPRALWVPVLPRLRARAARRPGAPARDPRRRWSCCVTIRARCRSSGSSACCPEGAPAAPAHPSAASAERAGLCAVFAPPIIVVVVGPAADSVARLRCGARFPRRAHAFGARSCSPLLCCLVLAGAAAIAACGQTGTTGSGRCRASGSVPPSAGFGFRRPGTSPGVACRPRRRRPPPPRSTPSIPPSTAASSGSHLLRHQHRRRVRRLLEAGGDDRDGRGRLRRHPRPGLQADDRRPRDAVPLVLRQEVDRTASGTTTSPGR